MKGRVLILGLDSATFDVIDEFIGSGRLPNFAKICREGIRAEMISTYPPRTGPAWVTLMTGQNPGRHGIFDFWTTNVHGYDTVLSTLVTSANYAGNTVFDILGRNGKSIAALFVPMTFPAWAVNGVMIAGPPLTPNSDKGLSYQDGIHRKFGVEHDIHLHPPSIKEGIEKRKTLRDLMSMEEARSEVALRLWDSKDYDFLMFVLESIDIVQHRLWRYFKSDQPNSFKDTIPTFYEKADDILGRIINKLCENDLLFVVSDHGMTGHPEVCFSTNAWLATKGWLVFSKLRAVSSRLIRSGRNLTRRILPRHHYRKLKSRIKLSDAGGAKRIRMYDQGSAAIDWNNTTAYRFQMPDPPLEGIMLNVRGRQPQGIIPEDSVEEVASRIKKELLRIRDPHNGSQIIKAVYKREELYSGPYANKMPDLIIEFTDGYKGDGRFFSNWLNPTPAINLSHMSGTHSLRGIFMAYGKPFGCGKKLEPVRIADFAPTLFYAMNQTVPGFMDGEVQLKCFKEEFIKEHKIEIQEMEMVRIHDQTTYTDEETSQIEEKLRSLGYL